MTSESDWLERLTSATEYRELQAIFAEILADSRSTVDGVLLAEKVDQAILRLEQERSRDEAELQAIQQEYDAFKQQRQGVVGWFKRHMPFTETRRQELEHRTTMADQQAEILADNLVIARAQMLKQRLLPSDQREFGLDVWQWRNRLQQHDSVVHLPSLADDVRELADELTRSESFLQAVMADVQAFADAEFSSRDDQQRQGEDLAAARRELEILRAEVSEERELRKSSLQRLGTLVEDELADARVDFRELQQRLKLLKDARQFCEQASGRADELHDALQRLAALEQEQDGLPQELEQVQGQLRHLRDKLHVAERQSRDAELELRNETESYETARRAAAEAESAFAASERIYQAYRQQQQESAEIDGPSGFAASSPVQAEYDDQQQKLSRAREQLREATGPYEDAKRRAGNARAELDVCTQQVDEATQKEQSLLDRQVQLRRDLIDASEAATLMVKRLQPMLEPYRRALNALSWPDRLPSLETLPDPHVRFGAERGATPSFGIERPTSREEIGQPRLRELIAQLVESLKRDAVELDRDRTHREQARREIWQRRCHELLDPKLADEVFREVR